MSIEIRAIQEKDIGGIKDILFKTMEGDSKEYCRQIIVDIKYYLSHKDKSAQFVALEGDEVIGFALAGIINESEVEKYYFIDHSNPQEPLSWVLLGQISIDPAYQGKRIGSLLLKKIETRSGEMPGIKGIYTGTRGDIRFFYEKNGFVIDKIYLKKLV